MKEIRKVAAVVVRNNEFLMVRKVGKDTWTSLGGHIEPGETEEQALLREIQEEVGCIGHIVRKLGDFRAKAAFDDAIVCLATYLVQLQGEIQVQDPELEEARFIPQYYHELGIKMPQSIEEGVIPFCIQEGLLKW